MDNLNSERQIFKNPAFLIVMGVICGVVLVSIFAYVNTFFNRHNFPCFCKKCEQVLVDEAINGNPSALAALEGGQYKTNFMQLGPLSWVVGLFIVALIATGIYMLQQRADLSPFERGFQRARSQAGLL